MTQTAARLIGAIQADRLVLARLYQRIQGALLARPWQQASPILYLVAVTLDHYYTAAEAILERVAREFEGLPPSGPRWHNDLLDQMEHPIPTIRPAVVRPETTRELRDLLSFRHFMRHAYAVELEPQRLVRLAEGLTSVHATLAADLDLLEASLTEPDT